MEQKTQPVTQVELKNILARHVTFLRGHVANEFKADFKGKILDGLTIEDQNLDGVDFSDASLKGATFLKTKLDNANFENADLVGAIFRNDCVLVHANFKNTNLMNAEISDSKLSKADFQGANLQQSKLIKNTISKALFGNAQMSGAEISTTDAAQVSFSPRCNLNFAKFTNCTLLNPDFSNSDIRNADFQSSVLSDANFSNCIIDRSNFSGSQITKCNFRRSRIKKAIFKGAVIKDTSFIKANLSSAEFGKAKFNIVKFDSSKLNRASLVRAELSDVNLFNSSFVGANFQKAKFGRITDIIGAKFWRTDCRLTNLDNKIYPHLLPDQFSGSNLQGSALCQDFWKSIEESAKLAANHARKLFSPIILACAYLFIIAFQAERGKFYKLPFLQLDVSMQNFFIIGNVILFLYFLFLYYIDSLWESISKLPAIFPDSSLVTKRPDPWFLINYVSGFNSFLCDKKDFKYFASVFLIYMVVPMVLVAVAMISFYMAEPDSLDAIPAVLFYISMAISGRYFEKSKRVLSGNF